MNLSTCRIVLISVSALAASCSLAAEKSFDKRFDAPPGGHLTVQTEVGAVTVVGHDSREVAVHAEVSGVDADRMSISAEQDSSGVVVRGLRAPSILFGWNSLQVRFTIDVPNDYPVEIETAGGRIDVRALNASVRGRTAGGGIIVRDVAGATRMHTSGGSIEAERLNGPVDLGTSGGSIDINDVTGDLDAHTSGGHIRLVNVDGKVNAHTSGGSVSAEVRANRGIALSTSGGSISLRLPAAAHASIDAATGGGSVRSGLPLSTETAGHSYLRGNLNGGGDAISLHTLGGSIDIDAL
jgi:DUF4097 and DUF4098 domain-containing protein YvlB